MQHSISHAGESSGNAQSLPREIISVDVDTLPEGWDLWSEEEFKEYVTTHNYPKITINE